MVASMKRKSMKRKSAKRSVKRRSGVKKSSHKRNEWSKALQKAHSEPGMMQKRLFDPAVLARARAIYSGKPMKKMSKRRKSSKRRSSRRKSAKRSM